ISYSRMDGATYAAGLANELAAKSFAVRLDQWGSDPGRQIPKSLKRALWRSSMLVLVATRGAGASQAVEQELQEFSRTGRTIIPIDCANALDQARWVELVRGLAFSAESAETVSTGHPSASVLNRIENSFSFRRRDQRLRLGAAIMSAVLVVLLL